MEFHHPDIAINRILLKMCNFNITCIIILAHFHEFSTPARNLEISSDRIGSEINRINQCNAIRILENN